MGNKKSKPVDVFVSNILDNVDSKSNAVLQWYNQEKLRHECDEFGPKCDDVTLKCDVEKCFRMLTGRRRVGISAIEKILSITSPIFKLNKVRSAFFYPERSRAGRESNPRPVFLFAVTAHRETESSAKISFSVVVALIRALKA